jgi:tRNA threonylcarbamoyladenosine biosynthesis protein TsaB
LKILALDHATECCSAALWRDDELAGRECPAARDHGGALLGMIDALLSEAGLALRELDAIAFGRGPGAFTGLRLAASVTQGLAYAAGLPVIPVSDLRALAQQLMSTPDAPTRVLACADARMGEVYWAAFSCVAGHARADLEEAVVRPAKMMDAAQRWLGGEGAGGAGSGFEAHGELAALGARLAPLAPAMRPRAHEVAVLAAHDGLAAAVAPELALPVYLRNDVAVPPASASAS